MSHLDEEDIQRILRWGRGCLKSLVDKDYFSAIFILAGQLPIRRLAWQREAIRL